jgi:hypothetical protein
MDRHREVEEAGGMATEKAIRQVPDLGGEAGEPVSPPVSG